MRSMKGALAVLATLLWFAAVNCSVDDAATAPAFSTLVDLIDSAGLADTIDGPFTIFAPTNGAFEMLDSSVINYLVDPDNVELLQNVLSYHMVSGRVLSTDLTNGNVATIEGSTIEISIDNSPPTVNGVDIIYTDIISTFGVIHVISGVLLPPGVTPTDFSLGVTTADDTLSLNTIVEYANATEDFSTLVDLVVRAGLADTLSGDGPFTLFAPPNDAFGLLDSDVIDYLMDPTNTGALQDVLTYHVVSGRVPSTNLTSGYVDTLQGSSIDISLNNTPPTVNGIDIVATDILSSNGVIHVISNVLLPPGFSPDDFTIDAGSPVSVADDTSVNTIVEYASATEDFSTLVDLVVRAGLADTLSGDGPFTLFAPPNDAFGMLDSNVLDFLVDPSNAGALQDLLTYHVISGGVLSSNLTNGYVDTLQGTAIDISLNNTVPTVNGIDIIATDILVSNGVIHVISNVLIPTTGFESVDRKPSR